MENKKKNIEEKCLEQALKAGLKDRGETKRILQELVGEEIERLNTERPDFIKRHFSKSKCEKDTIVGIEHFRADHLSVLKQNGDIGSSGIVFEKDVYKLYDKWHVPVQNGEAFSEKMLEEIGQTMADQLIRLERATYHSFIDSFKYSLEKHLNSVSVYRQNLMKHATSGERIKLAFLIEIHTEMGHLFLNDKKGTRRNNNGNLPIFQDIVDILEKIDTKKVDFIILCMGDTLYNSPVKVIALRTGNIEKQLKRRGIFIYEYAGEDLILTNFQTVRKDIQKNVKYMADGDKIDYSLNFTAQELDHTHKLYLLFYAFRKALACKRKGYNYVTTLSVQSLVDVFGDFVIDWEIPKDRSEEWKVKPVFLPVPIEVINQRYEDFDKKWKPVEKQ